jgi:hypothetical protein
VQGIRQQLLTTALACSPNPTAVKNANAQTKQAVATTDFLRVIEFPPFVKTFLMIHL